MTVRSRPRVTLKLATSLDGRIALSNGRSKWITGPESRAEVHRIRSRHDAILTGIGTILADDPEFTVRLDGYTGRQPDIIVMDRQGRLPAKARVFDCSGRTVRTISCGVFEDALSGHKTVMVEAGSGIAAAALRADCVDRIEWFRAPVILGGDGKPVFDGLGLETLDQAPRFARMAMTERGMDIQETYERMS